MNIQSIDNIGEEVEFEDENEDNWMTDIDMSQIEKVMDNLHPTAVH